MGAVSPTATPRSSTSTPARSCSCAPTARRPRARTVEITDPTASVTMLGTDRAVFGDTDGDLVVASPGNASSRSASTSPAPTASRSALALQQPGTAADRRGRRHAGRQGRLDPALARRRRRPRSGRSVARARSPPIVYGGCVFAISTKPATFGQWCGDGTNGDGSPRWKEVQSLPLDGVGAELRLRLVNGWIWINDLDSGAAWVTSPQQRIDRVEDWGNILSQLTDDSDDDDSDEDGGEVITEVNPDDPTAEIVQSDEIDEQGPNRPPIARDDVAETRVDRPIDIDVLANDTDPNGDVLVVTAVQPGGGDAQIVIAPDGRSVQVSPAAGFAGSVSFGYTITDGRDASASASVTVDVRASDGSANRPPEAHNDIASTRRGRPTTFDVLANDTDPDGDALVLDSIALEDPASTAGRIVPDASGQVVFTPDPNTTAERIELTYTASDDFGADRRGHGDRQRPPRRRQQRARRPQRRRRDGRRQADPARRPGQRHRPRRRPPVRRPAADARAPSRPHDRLARRVTDARRRAVLRSGRRRDVRVHVRRDRRRGDRRRPDPHRGRGPDGEPPADGDPRRRRHPGRRHPARARARERRRSRRRHHRARRPRGRRRQRADRQGGRRRRLRGHRRSRRADPPDVPLRDLRRPQRAGVGRRRRRRHPRRRGRPAPGRPRRRGRGARRRQGVRPRARQRLRPGGRHADGHRRDRGRRRRRGARPQRPERRRARRRRRSCPASR